MDHRLLEILACPICQGKLILSDNHQGLICRFDNLFYPIKDGIPVLLENEAVQLNTSTDEEG